MRFRPAAHFSSFAFTLLSFSALLFAGCSGKGGESAVSPPAEVVAFEVSPATVALGESTRIIWKTRFAVEVRIFAGAEPLQLEDPYAEEGELEFFPTADTDFTLEAQGVGRQVARAKARVQVTGTGELAILRFDAAPQEILRGETTTLSWEVRGATGLSLRTDGGAEVELPAEPLPENSVQVQPAETTVYTLTALGPRGQEVVASREVLVRTGGPSIELSATPERIQVGESATLSWSAFGVRELRILGADGEEVHRSSEAQGSLEVQPARTTTYRAESLDAEEEQVEASATVAVQPLIDSFTVVHNETVRPGMPVALAWKTRGATRLTLSNVEGEEIEIPSEEMDEGSASLEAGQFGTFRLRARSGNLEDEAFVQVQVTNAPLIRHFSVGPEVTAGRGVRATVRVAWETAGATELFLQADPGDTIPLNEHGIAKGELEVEVGAPTRFRLTAANSTGRAEQELDAPVVLPAFVEALRAAPRLAGDGDAVEVAWSVRDAVSIVLEQNGLPVDEPSFPLQGEYEAIVAGMGPHVFTLRAQNALGHEVSSEVEVQVGAPALLSFEVDRSRVPTGHPLTFTWTATGGHTLRIVDELDESEFCTTQDPAQIESGQCTGPAPTTEREVRYRIEVENGSGKDEAHREVTVIDRPIIDAFDVEPKEINQGEVLTFTWLVQDDASGELVTLRLRDQDGKDYSLGSASPNMGQAEIPIDEPGAYTFTLSAFTSGTVNPEEMQAFATVHGLPVIETFVANPDDVDTPGDPSVLQWKTRHARSLELYALAPDGSVHGTEPIFVAETQGERDEHQFTVYPDSTAHAYRLVIENPMGVRVEQELEIEIYRITIEDFYADQTEILEGEEVTFTWISRNADNAVVDRGRGEFVDIRGDGGPVEPITFSGNNSLIIPLPFPDGFTYPFDGRRWSKTTLFSSGYLSFNLAAASGIVTELPETARRANLVAYARRLNTRGIGELHQALRNDPLYGRHLIVQWSDWDDHASNVHTLANFQIVLWERDGAFEFRYGSMAKPGQNDDYANGRQTVIGWQNLASDYGVEFWPRSGPRIPGGLEHRTILGPSEEPFPAVAFPPSGSWTTKPTHSATYTLRAWNDFNRKSASVDITVHARAELDAFVLDSWPVPGGPVRLGWEGSNLSRVVIEDGNGTPIFTTTDPARLQSGEFDVGPLPQGDHSFTIKGTGLLARDVVSRQVEVGVYPHFGIDSFTADRGVVDLPDGVTLSWQTTNAATLSLEAIPGGPISLEGKDLESDSILLQPQETTTYRLTVGNYGWFREAELEVRVRAARMDSLLPAESFSKQGDPVTLTWQTSGAGTIRIEPERAWLTLAENGASPFVDLNEAGGIEATLIGNKDSGKARIDFPAGFEFPWFGETYTYIMAMADGFLSFSEADNSVAHGSTKYLVPAYRLPTGTRPTMAAFAPFWAELDGKTTGKILYKFVEDAVEPARSHVVVQWSNWQFKTAAHNGGSGSAADLNFQVALYRDGSVEFRYGTMHSGSQAHADGLVSSIGFQALTFDKGHQLSLDAVLPGGLSNRSWRFSPPRLDANGAYTFTPLGSGPVRVCIETAIGSDCQESRLNVLLPGDLLITELMLDPLNNAPQWFEVRNVSSGVIDLNGMLIEIDGAGHTIQNGGPLLVQPGQYAVLARGQLNGVPADVPVYVYGNSLVMPVLTGEIVLSRDGLAVAKASWKDNFGPKGASLELLPNRQRPGWVEGAGFEHFAPATGSYDGPNLGTPGRHGRMPGSYGIDPFSDRGPIDISTVGTLFPGLNDNLSTEPLSLAGMEVRLFDDELQGLNVSRHGFASLGAPTSSAISSSLAGNPSGNGGLGIFAPFAGNSAKWAHQLPSLPLAYRWAELVVDGQGVLVVQWENLALSWSGHDGYATFQMQIWENGEVVFHYFDMGGHPAYFGDGNLPIGLREAHASSANPRFIEYSFKERSLRPGQTIHLWPQ